MTAEKWYSVTWKCYYIEESMTRYRQLFTPRWLAGHVLALTLIALFLSLGAWQLRRLDQRQTYNALLESRLEAQPQPFDLLREEYDLGAPEDVETSAAYRRAQVTGRFDPEREVLLRSRALDGQPGYHVLTPLVLDDNRALLVDRGWVPFELDEPPIAQAAPPTGEVSVTGILFPAQEQPVGFGPKDPAEGELDAVFFVNTERLEQQLPYRLEPIYLELNQQNPPQTAQLPVPPVPPELTEGSHFGYALQWFSFAAIGIIGYGFLMRSVLKDDGQDDEDIVSTAQAS